MSMPRLRDLQGQFWQAIATAPGELSASDELLAVTEPSVSLDATARLQVYVDAYLLRLREVLAEDFPRLAAFLGAERFAEVACDYLRAHPSVHPSVRHLGDGFPTFVTRRPELPPYLGDLARLERARTDVFDAPDDPPPLAVADLGALAPDAWPELRFAPIRALTLLRLDWPVHELWGSAEALPAAPAPTAVRVWRGAGYRVFHAVLEPRAACALERLVAGEPFGAICAAFDDLPPDEGARQASGLLARWLEDGTIAGTMRRGVAAA
jgi:hypothetical protein